MKIAELHLQLENQNTEWMMKMEAIVRFSAFETNFIRRKDGKLNYSNKKSIMKGCYIMSQEVNYCLLG